MSHNSSPGPRADERMRLIWAKTREIKPIVEAHRRELDTLRRLPDAIAAAFLERNVYRLLVPRDWGGDEVDPIAYFDLVMEVASYDGAVGWNYAIASSGPISASDFSAERLRALFSTPDCAAAGGGGGQPGRAVPEQGGYRVSGRWGWASGIHNARWVWAVAMVVEGGKPRLGPNGTPQMILFLVPKTDVEVLDTWHVGGMRGTGSTEFTVNEVFVPAERVLTRPFGGESRHEIPIFRVPSTFFGYALAAVALGIAQSALDGLKALAMAKVSSASRTPLKEQGHAQYAAAKAEALIESSALHVKDAFGRIWDLAFACQPVPQALKARARGSYVHAAESAAQAVLICYDAAGGSALFESLPFERALRDVKAAQGHFTVQRTMMEEAGRIAFGMPSQSPMF